MTRRIAYCLRCQWRTPHEGDRCTYCAAPPEPVPTCTESLDMFAVPAEAPAQRHSPTSVAAAARVQPLLSNRRRDLLLWICRHHLEGVTDNRLLRELTARGWSVNGIRPRRIELLRGGWLEEAGEREGSAVWRPTTKALYWYEDHLRAENVA